MLATKERYDQENESCIYRVTCMCVQMLVSAANEPDFRTYWSLKFNKNYQLLLFKMHPGLHNDL